MRKRSLAALCLSAVLMFGGLYACGGKTSGESSDGGNTETVNAVQEVGDFIELKAVDRFHEKIVNGSGMSGTAGSIHLHSAAKADMVLDDYTEFVFDIEHIEKLGELHVWNYNEKDGTSNGLKEITVSLSEDNKNYEKFGDFTLAKSSGENGASASDLADGGCIDFGGECARYIKIEAKSNYGGEGYGLSELRLFRYKQPIRTGESISASPIERYQNNKWSATAEDYNLTNGVGLSDPLSAAATHDNDPRHMVTKDEMTIDFKMDLKGEYPVSKLVVWNYNDPENLDYGLKEVRIRLSDDGNSWKAVGKYEMPKGTGENGMAPSLVVDCGNVQAHYIQIEIYSNYGGDRVGLSAATAFLGTGWFCDEVPDYTAMLSRYNGWAGADGIYTVNLDGKDYDYERDKSEQKTFFVFSDTIVSSVDPVTHQRKNAYMPNNTSAVLTGGKPTAKDIEFYYPENTKECANIRPNPLEPTTIDPNKHKYYWLGDTFVIGNKLYVYSLKIDSVDPGLTGFGFAQTGVDLARYDIVNGEPDFSSLTLINDTEGRLCDISDYGNRWYFGGGVYQSTESAGVINPDGYVYVYGYDDVTNQGRKLVVSRVKEADIEDFSKYEYLDSTGNWTKEKPSAFSYLASDVAPELSVTQIQSGEHKGKFVLVNSHITNSPTLKISIADSPFGKFENKTTIFSHDDCQALPGYNNNTYNAKAHPALSSANELIVTYNMNGDSAFTNADIYRPRFLRLAMVADAES